MDGTLGSHLAEGAIGDVCDVRCGGRDKGILYFRRSIASAAGSEIELQVPRYIV